MTWRKKIVLAATAILALSVVAIVISDPREPRYQGRPLSAWLAEVSSQDFQTQQRAREAIRQIGPAGVPYLTNSFARRKSTAQDLYRSGIIPRSVSNWVRKYIKFQHPLAESQNASASLALLGPAASEAIPFLIHSLNDSATVFALSAANALGAIGTNAIPPLLQRLPEATPSEQIWIFVALGAMSSNAAPAIPDITTFLASSDEHIANSAGVALMKIGPASIPTATNYLSHTNSKVSVRALSILGHFGSVIPPAIIIPYLENADPTIRYQAHIAFYGIMTNYDQANKEWLKSIHDPDLQIARLALRSLTIRPRDVRAYNKEIAPFATNSDGTLSNLATHSLNTYRAWPK